MQRKLLFYLLPFTFYLFATGCGTAPQYQEHFNIPGNAWNYSFRPEFKIDISDTASAYQLEFLIRHTETYPFNNIWLLMDTKGPGDTTFVPMRAEILLAASTGQWLGRGMGEVYEQVKPVNTSINPTLFRRKGTYTIRIAQDMRRNPLPDVMQVGLRLRKMGVTKPAAQ